MQFGRVLKMVLPFRFTTRAMANGEQCTPPLARVA